MNRNDMKTKAFICTLALSALVELQAQNPPPSENIIPPDATVEAVTRTDSTTDWEVKDADGNIVSSYVELGTGLNYWSESQNQFLPAKEEVELLDDGAVFRQAAYQVKISANHNDIAGALDITLPEGQKLVMQTIGLALTELETGRSVWLAESKDSVGVLVGDNVVVYPDAFDTLKADLQITFRKGSMQSDVILKEKPDNPQVFGFDPSKVRLEVWHQILQGPNPVGKVINFKRKDGQWDSDVELHWAQEMFMGPGKAFSLPQQPGDSGDAPVSKEQFTDATTQMRFLIESVPLKEITPALATLPDRQEARNVDRQKLQRQWAARREGKREKPVALAGMARQPAKPRNVASITRGSYDKSKGYVIDYDLMVGQANFRFQSDKTYWVTNEVNLTGETILEGGVVVKAAPYNNDGNSPSIKIHGALTCLTSPYFQSIFTCRDDGSVGEPISGATNSIQGNGYYAYKHLFFSSSITNAIDIHDVAFRYAHIGLGLARTEGHTLRNLQFYHCHRALELQNGPVSLRNVLMHDIQIGINAYDNVAMRMEHLTADGVAGGLLIVHTTNQVATLTNSILYNVVADLRYDSLPTTITKDSVQTIAGSSPSPFQTVGQGAHYLKDGSPYRNAGTTSINTALAADLKRMTTYPPILLTSSITTETTLLPAVEKDWGLPDLGYHYQVLDYLAGQLDVYSSLSLSNGVALGIYGTSGLKLHGGSSVYTDGAPNNLTKVVRFQTVQEQPVRWGGDAFDMGMFTLIGDSGAAPSFKSRFTLFSVAGDRPSQRRLIHGNSYPVSTVAIRDCIFQNCFQDTGHNNATAAASWDLQNNLFCRSYLVLQQGWGEVATARNVALNFRNNTVWRGALKIWHYDNSLNPWTIKDSIFDGPYREWHVTSALTPPYNAYAGNPAFVSGAAGSLESVAFNWQTGALGSFYLPSNSVCINAGSTSDAGTAGLYHYTTQTGQTKEANTALDIGCHFVAVDGNGDPLDTDGDGNPDFKEDANGNGTADSGELNWQSSNLSNANSLGLVLYKY